jgi:hypothetical protein
LSANLEQSRFVTADDFAYGNTKGIKVFKIHGSINNYGSIIAADTDYRKCRKSLRDGILGATLKHIIGTKTIYYVGYTFSDSAFKQIYLFLRDEMREILPHSYMVTSDPTMAKAIAAQGFTPIITDGQRFISVLKEHAVADGKQIDDSRFEGIELVYSVLFAAHKILHTRYQPSKTPFMIYTSGYQDGFMQALDRTIARVKTGECSCPGCLVQLIQEYEDIRKEKMKRRKLTDIAYIDGYINGLLFIIATDDERKDLPLWYVTYDMRPSKNLHQYSKELRKAERMHPNRLRYAHNIVRRSVGPNGSPDLHHIPFLL